MIANKLKQIVGDIGIQHTFTAINKGNGTTGGSVILHGARIGDTLIGAYSLSAPDDETAEFEATVTVPNQIQQANPSEDLSAARLIFVLKR